jgi:cation diffusion facilitator family transporter
VLAAKGPIKQLNRQETSHYTDNSQTNHHDHNLRAAYLHVLADTLTSFLAIFALLAAKYFGAMWMDPLMGVIGALLVSRWSLGLLRTTAAVLLDKQGPKKIESELRAIIEKRDDNRIADFHLWSVGPRIYAVIISIVTNDPKPPDYYREMIPPGLGLVHITVEVRQRTD